MHRQCFRVVDDQHPDDQHPVHLLHLAHLLSVCDMD
jgi:hypothetical protein